MSNDYVFTEDWFSSNIPYLWKVLSPLKGKVCKMLEIGSYEGRSTVWFLENILTHPHSTIVCIDPFTGSVEHTEEQIQDIQAHFAFNVYRSFAHKVTHYKTQSHVALKYHNLCNDSFDVVYVDGNHCAANVLEDAVLSFRMLKVGGIMVFDDLEWNMQTTDRKYYPAIGIQAFMHGYGHFFEIVHKGYQLILRKIADM